MPRFTWQYAFSSILPPATIRSAATPKDLCSRHTFDCPALHMGCEGYQQLAENEWRTCHEES